MIQRNWKRLVDALVIFVSNRLNKILLYSSAMNLSRISPLLFNWWASVEATLSSLLYSKKSKNENLPKFPNSCLHFGVVKKQRLRIHSNPLHAQEQSDHNSIVTEVKRGSKRGVGGQVIYFAHWDRVSDSSFALMWK